MMECTSPALTVKIDSLEDFVAMYIRVQIFDFEYAHVSLSHASFQADAQQFLRFDRKLHRQVRGKPACRSR